MALMHVVLSQAAHDVIMALHPRHFDVTSPLGILLLFIYTTAAPVPTLPFPQPTLVSHLSSHDPRKTTHTRIRKEISEAVRHQETADPAYPVFKASNLSSWSSPSLGDDHIRVEMEHSFLLSVRYAYFPEFCCFLRSRH